MARLAITATARADLKEIRDHIAKDDPDAARRVERLRERARQLSRTPAWVAAAPTICGAISTHSRSADMSLFYRPQPRGIVLIRVVHGSRDLPTLFGTSGF